MASYSIVAPGAREPMVISPTKVLDVQTIPFVTHPTEIYAQWWVTWQQWLDQGAGPTIGPLADTIEGLIANTAAVDASYAQDLDPNGLLVDYLDFLVEYDSGNQFVGVLQTTVRIPMGALTAAADPFFGTLAASPDALINKAAARLQQDAGL